MIEPSEIGLFKPKLTRSITLGQGYDLHSTLLEILRVVYDGAHKNDKISSDAYRQLERLFDRFSTREFYAHKYKNPYAFRAAILEAIDAILLEQQRQLRPW